MHRRLLYLAVLVTLVTTSTAYADCTTSGDENNQVIHCTNNVSNVVNSGGQSNEQIDLGSLDALLGSSPQPSAAPMDIPDFSQWDAGGMDLSALFGWAQ